MAQSVTKEVRLGAAEELRLSLLPSERGLVSMPPIVASGWLPLCVRSNWHSAPVIAAAIAAVPPVPLHRSSPRSSDGVLGCASVHDATRTAIASHEFADSPRGL